MGDDGLPVAHVLWLLGQDDRYLRPRTGAMPATVIGAALVDVVAAGAARWVDLPDDTLVEATGAPAPGGLVGEWAGRVEVAGTAGPMSVVHALDALGLGLWDAVGADLATDGHAETVPRPVRGWKGPRLRPDPGLTAALRGHLRRVVDGRDAATDRDHAVLAVAGAGGVLEHVLSSTAFTDETVLEPAERFLIDSDLVRRLEPALMLVIGIGRTGLPFPSGGMGGGSGGS